MTRSRQFEVTHYRRTSPVPEKETRAVVLESALVISVNGEADYAIMRTPGNDRELAVGFLFSEGMIGGVGEVTMLMECPDAPNSIFVKTSRPDAAVVKRNLVISSSCGLCGRADIEALVAGLPAADGQIRMEAALLYAVPASVRGAQALFAETGGTHAAALFDPQGRLLVVREDVGRHNALDKVIGNALLTGVAMNGLGVFLSGRASLEMIVKAARARIPIVAAVSAPTEAAVDVAGRLGITLCGFVRGDEVTVYTHEYRLASGEDPHAG